MLPAPCSRMSGTTARTGGLWSVFYCSLRHHLGSSQRGTGTDDVRQAVQHDVHRAADVLRRGL